MRSSSVVTVALIQLVCSGSEQNFSGTAKGRILRGDLLPQIPAAAGPERRG